MIRPSESVWRALDLYRGLIRPGAALRQPLPGDMLTVIALATGEEAALNAQQLQTGEAAETLNAAAACLLEILLTRGGSSDHALLALNPGAAPEAIRAHKRALLKWLHPDRNKNAWQAALYAKVSAAAHRLEKNEPEERGTAQRRWRAPGRRRTFGRYRLEGARQAGRKAGTRSKFVSLRKISTAAALLAALLLLLQWKPGPVELLQAQLPGF